MLGRLLNCSKQNHFLIKMEPLWLLLLGTKAGLRIGHFLERCSVKGNTQTKLPLGTNEKAFVVPNSQA